MVELNGPRAAAQTLLGTWFAASSEELSRAFSEESLLGSHGGNGYWAGSCGLTALWEELFPAQLQDSWG